MRTQYAAGDQTNRHGDTRACDARPQTDSLDPRHINLATLARRCAAESEHFYRGQPYDTRFAYELFRRALVERDELAWEHVYTHYSLLVESWVRRSGAFAGSGESSEFFVCAAFTKFWRAVTPDRFDTFPNLAALLHYLQLCAGSVVIDSVRAQSWAEVVSDDGLLAGQRSRMSPDEEALDRVSRAEFWRLVEAQLNGEAELFVVIASFVLGLKSGEIYDKRPDLFVNVNDVYNVKRNVLSRLARNAELRNELGM